MSSRVYLLGHTHALVKERKATGAIIPGHLVKPDATGGIAVQNGTGITPIHVALEQEYVGSNTATLGIDQAYAAGDQVKYACPLAGHELNLLVAPAAAAIVYGDYIESAGDGTVRKQTAGTPAYGTVRMVARQAVDNSGGASVARIRVEVIL